MPTEPSPSPCDPLDDPGYLRDQSRRLSEIVSGLADPEIKKELAAHSLYLAQRAEAITRSAEDPAIMRMNVQRYRTMLAAGMAEDDRRTVERLLGEAESALDGGRSLRELSALYRALAARVEKAAAAARRPIADGPNADAEAVHPRRTDIDQGDGAAGD